MVQKHEMATEQRRRQDMSSAIPNEELPLHKSEQPSRTRLRRTHSRDRVV